jgi:hypothetical protein
MLAAASAVIFVACILGRLQTKSANLAIISSSKIETRMKTSPAKANDSIKRNSRGEYGFSSESSLPPKTRVRDRSHDQHPVLSGTHDLKEISPSEAATVVINDRNVSQQAPSNFRNQETAPYQARYPQPVDHLTAAPENVSAQTETQERSQRSVVTAVAISDTTHLTAHQQATIRELNTYVEEASLALGESSQANATVEAERKKIALTADEYLRITLGKDVFNQLSVIAALERQRCATSSLNQ